MRKPFPKRPASDFIMGMHPIMEAIRAGKEIDKILVQKGLKGDLYFELKKILAEFNIPSQQVPVEKLNSITRANHQGVIAFAAAVSFGNLEEIIAATFSEGKVPKLVLLDGITDVRNFGAIARTAECQGFDAVIIPEKGSAQVNSDAVKTSAGALNYIPICRVKSVVWAVQLLQASGVQVVGCTEKTNTLIQSIDYTLPTCVVMGAEDTGISDEVIRKADHLGKIEMMGNTSSLNVSVAAGMIMYEVNRQRLIS